MRLSPVIPWNELTRGGLEIPQFRITRRPLTAGSRTFLVGEEFDATVFVEALRKLRLRQYYESHRLEPIGVPCTLRDVRAARQAMAAPHQPANPAPAVKPPMKPVAVTVEVPEEPPRRFTKRKE